MPASCHVPLEVEPALPGVPGCDASESDPGVDAKLIEGVPEASSDGVRESGAAIRNQGCAYAG